MPEPSSTASSTKKTKKKKKDQGKAALAPAPPASPPDPLHMETFFPAVEDIRTNLDKIESNCDAVDRAHQTILSSASETEIREQEAIISGYIHSTNQLSGVVKDEIEQMEAETERLEPNAPPGSGDLRMRKINGAALLKKFTLQMKRLQEIQQHASSKHQAQVERQYRISTNHRIRIMY